MTSHPQPQPRRVSTCHGFFPSPPDFLSFIRSAVLFSIGLIRNSLHLKHVFFRAVILGVFSNGPRYLSHKVPLFRWGRSPGGHVRDSQGSFALVAICVAERGNCENPAPITAAAEKSLAEKLKARFGDKYTRHAALGETGGNKERKRSFSFHFR